MDYNKLAKIADGWGNPNCKRSVSVPKSMPKGGSVLDRMEVRSKISDSEQKPTVKVMILDDVQINKIMSAPREEKRRVLSRLSDSQRRRVLARYRELQKVKDDESVTRLNLVTLDSLLNNCIINSDEYSKNLIEQWKSAYETPTEIEGFIDAVINGDTDGINNGFEGYTEFMDGKDIKSMIEMPTNEPIAEDTESTEADTAEETSDEEDGITELAEDTEDVADLDMTEDFPEEGIPEFNDIDEGIEDSIKNVAYYDCLTYLAGGKKSVLQMADSSIMSLAVKFGCDYDKVANIYDEAWSGKLIETKQGITDNANALLGKLAAKKAMDSVIDEFAEKPMLDSDGNEEGNDEDRPILEVLSEALEAYVSGDSSLLEEIANLDTAGNKINKGDMTAEEEALATENEELKDELAELKENESEKIGEAAEEHKEDETAEANGIKDSADEDKDSKDADAEEEVEPFNTTESTVECQCPTEKLENAEKAEDKEEKELAKELAQLLKCIEKGTDCGEIKDSRLNTLIDSLQSKVPALQKYNFKVNDCNYPFYSQVEQPASVMNIPMNRCEYYAMCPVVPECFDLVCANYGGAQQCPECVEYEVKENGLCINPTTNPQSYYPVNCTLQEIADLLSKAQPKEYTAIVNDHCIPMSDAFKVAAMTNSLSFIDNTFYKKYMGDSAWSFDEVPECLKGVASKAGAIKLVTKKTDSSVELWGQNFEIL